MNLKYKYLNFDKAVPYNKIKSVVGYDFLEISKKKLSRYVWNIVGWNCGIILQEIRETYEIEQQKDKIRLVRDV